MLNILVGTITMAAALRMAVPLILSSIGGCFGDRTGIFNIALESFMLCAAFFATLGTYYSGSPYVGVLCGILAGLACAVLFGTLVFHLGSSGMVVSPETASGLTKPKSTLPSLIHPAMLVYSPCCF